MNLLTISLILVSIIIIGLVLIQDRSSGVGGAFGGGDGGGGQFQRRRGAEKVIFNITIVTIIIFASLSIWNLLRHQQEGVQTEVEAPGIEFEATDIEATTEDGQPVNIVPEDTTETSE